MQSYSHNDERIDIIQSGNSQLFRRQSSPFRNQKLQYPTKTKPQNKNEVVYTQKSSFFCPDDKHRALVETRPFPSKIQLQMTSEPQIPLLVNFGKTRQLPAPDA